MSQNNSRGLVGSENKRLSSLAFMSILKAIFIILVLTVQGIVIGFYLNIIWHFFLAGIIGWGENAPDWYFEIQEAVFLFIFYFGLIGWISFRILTRKKPGFTLRSLYNLISSNLALKLPFLPSKLNRHAPPGAWHLDRSVSPTLKKEAS